jgi:hypothetical protein
MFEEAYKIEQEYIKLPPKEADKFYYKERMELAGYPDLSKYFLEKDEYLFNINKPKIDETTLDNLKTDTMKVISSGDTRWFNIKTDRNWVFLGKVADYNAKFCTDNKISILPLNHTGGIIVTTPEDFNLVIIMKEKNLMSYIQKKIAECLVNLGVENIVYGNDIMIDGNKVSGCAETDMGEYVIYYFQISFNVNMELIETICNKKMIKTPKGITQIYPNITRDNLIEEIKKWLL